MDVMSFRLILWHDLHGQEPLWEIAFLYGIEQISLGIVGVNPTHLVRRVRVEILDSLLGLEMPFHVKQLVLRVDQAVCVTAEAVHMTVAIGCAAVREENRHLM